MKEKFTQEEWQLLKLLPFQVFVLVAGADGRIDKGGDSQNLEQGRLSHQ